MTWGCNASYTTSRCRRCGGTNIDDRDQGPTSHEQVCPHRVARNTIMLGAMIPVALILIAVAICLVTAGLTGGDPWQTLDTVR